MRCSDAYVLGSMLIYLIRNKINGKMYVGQTERSLAERWLEHIHSAAKYPLYHAFRKYGVENFELVQITTADNQEQADRLEQALILICRSHGRGYNQTDGGKRGARGHKLSEQAKDKLRKYRLGRKASVATRKRISEVQLGRDKGKVLSAEHKEKISQSLRWPPARLAYEQALMREQMKNC